MTTSSKTNKSRKDKKEILKKAIEKAIENGWQTWWTPYLKENKEKRIKVILKFKNTLQGVGVQITGYGDVDWDGYCKGGLLDWSNGYVFALLKFESVVFDKDFAKAFWGEKHLGYRDFEGPTWKYHLQQMVLEEDPIRYLEQFI